MACFVALVKQTIGDRYICGYCFFEDDGFIPIAFMTNMIIKIKKRAFGIACIINKVMSCLCFRFGVLIKFLKTIYFLICAL